MKRKQYDILLSRLLEPRRFIQVLAGPRQVGKSTLLKQVVQTLSSPSMLISTDGVDFNNKEWIANQWNSARLMLRQREGLGELILCIDEIQNIRDWSKYVKAEYDYDTLHDIPIKVVISGSSRVMLMHGLSESLAGRFEMIYMPHWSFSEMREAFDIDIYDYIYFGSYPGSAALMKDEHRWRNYIRSAIIDATMERDVLIDKPVNNPALLRKTFELASAYSGQELSVQKIVGELQDFGSASTAKNYLTLLAQSGLVAPLEKYSVDLARTRSSIPKMQVFNNALRTYYDKLSYSQIVIRPEVWGRLYESSVGCHLLNATLDGELELFYWRERDKEVDYILRKGKDIIALEVKSNRISSTVGLSYFREKFHPYRSYVIGEQGLPIEQFMAMNVLDLF